MKLNEMTSPEKLALSTLVRVMVGVDGMYSAEESAGVQSAAEDLGEDEFWSLINEIGHEHLTEDVIKGRARAVERPEARETIFSALFGIAATGSIVEQEGWILDWLAETWELEPDEPDDEEEARG